MGFPRFAAAARRPGRLKRRSLVAVGPAEPPSPLGISWPLTDGGVVTSTHRGHGHVLAKGGDLTAMFAELMGRRRGTCAARDGSMHIADVSLGIFGANGIIGAGLPIACGAAQAARMRDAGGIAVAYFGDGAVSQGAFHEAVTTACHLELPLLSVRENNQYAKFTNTSSAAAVPLEQRAFGYGIRFERVDGNEVEAVAATADRLVAELRAGAPPILLEAVTLRARGHYEGDAEEYRDLERDSEWAGRDPLALAALRLSAEGLSNQRLEEIREEVETEIAAALAAARESREPEVFELLAASAPPSHPLPTPPLSSRPGCPTRRGSERRCSRPWNESGSAKADEKRVAEDLGDLLGFEPAGGANPEVGVVELAQHAFDGDWVKVAQLAAADSLFEDVLDDLLEALPQLQHFLQARAAEGDEVSEEDGPLRDVIGNVAHQLRRQGPEALLGAAGAVADLGPDGDHLGHVDAADLGQNALLVTDVVIETAAAKFDLLRKFLYTGAVIPLLGEQRRGRLEDALPLDRRRHPRRFLR